MWPWVSEVPRSVRVISSVSAAAGPTTPARARALAAPPTRSLRMNTFRKVRASAPWQTMVVLSRDYGKGGDGSTTAASPVAKRLYSGAHGGAGGEDRVVPWTNPPARTMRHLRGPLLGSPPSTPAAPAALISRLRRGRLPRTRPLWGTAPVALPPALTPSPPWRSNPSSPSPSPRW